MKFPVVLLLLVAGCFQATGDDVSSNGFAVSTVPAYFPPPDDAPDWVGLRWPDATVHYLIDTTGTWPSAASPNTASCKKGVAMTQGQIDAIHAAVRELQDLGPVRFVEHTAASPPPSGNSFVMYRNVQSTASATTTRGMPIDGSTVDCVVVQPVAAGSPLVNDAEGRRLMLHETLHALGMDHEQQRTDRDSYIQYDATCANVGDTQKIFEINDFAQPLTPYDRSSIMHYASTNSCGDPNDPNNCKDASGNCKNPPLLYIADPNCPASDYESPPTSTDCRFIAKPMQLSVHDVNGLYRMYEAERSLGHNNDGDALASALATGDFDKDGYMDLAVGAPGQRAVFLWRGTAGTEPGSLGRLVKWKVLEPIDTGVASSTAWSIGEFGAALVAGDFDGDGATDLAVGAPGTDSVAGNKDDGSVFVYLSTKVTNSPRRTLRYGRLINPLTESIEGQPGDRFGAALAAGDLDGDAKADLVIGIPQRTLAGVRSGIVVVVSAADLFSLSAVLTPLSVPGTVQRAGARFGHALALASLNPDGDSNLDIVIGSPESATSPQRSGAVYLFRGLGNGTFQGLQELRANTPFAGMRFGTSLATGNFTFAAPSSGGRIPVQIAIGAPRRTLTLGTFGYDEAGSVFVFSSGSSSVINFEQAVRVDEATPGAGHHFGGALTSLVSFTFVSDNLRSGHRLIVGVPGAPSGGAVEQFDPILPQGFTQTSTNLGPRIGGGSDGDQFGLTLATANLLPAANPQQSPGKVEVIAGAPGTNGGAGAFYLHDFDVEEVVSWIKFDQETQTVE